MRKFSLKGIGSREMDLSFSKRTAIYRQYQATRLTKTQYDKVYKAVSKDFVPIPKLEQIVAPKATRPMAPLCKVGKLNTNK